MNPVVNEFVIRTEFDINRFRIGAREVDEFRSGPEFEQFMVGYHSLPKDLETYRDLTSHTPWCPFWPLFIESIKWSIENGKDYTHLSQLSQPCFAPYLFREIQTFLSPLSRGDLQMYSVVKTSIDYDYSVDCVFILGNSLITIDWTISLMKKVECKDPWHFVFTNNDLSQARTTAFARNIAQILQTNEGKKIPRKELEKIRYALLNRPK